MKVGLRVLFYCSLLALQYGWQPILAKSFSSPAASKSSIVLATEAAKIVIAVVSLFFWSPDERRKYVETWSVSEWLLVAGPPAVLYTTQNLLIQYGYGLLDAMTMNLLNQTKTLSAAFFLFLLMGRRQSKVQMGALVMLLVAAVVLTSAVAGGGGSGDESGPAGVALGLISLFSPAEVMRKVWELVCGTGSGGFGFGFGDYTLSLLAVGGASLLSGLSAAATQLALQARQRDSIVYSAEMAAVSMALLLAGDLYSGDGTSSLLSADVAHGWTPQTWIPVLTNASGGIIVGLVMQSAGSIVKGFALIAGILVTALTEYALDGTPLGSRHATSTALVCVSIYLHTSFPYVSDKFSKDEVVIDSKKKRE